MLTDQSGSAYSCRNVSVDINQPINNVEENEQRGKQSPWYVIYGDGLFDATGQNELEGYTTAQRSTQTATGAQRGGQPDKVGLGHAGQS